MDNGKGSFFTTQGLATIAALLAILAAELFFGGAL
jgi:hypothetical protein